MTGRALGLLVLPSSLSVVIDLSRGTKTMKDEEIWVNKLKVSVNIQTGIYSTKYILTFNPICQSVLHNDRSIQKLAKHAFFQIAF